MSDFTAQWANRHEGECEQYVHPLTGNPSTRKRPVDCYCYRRWLEGRLEECHSALRALLPKGEWWGLTFNQRYEKIRYILPPTGAGE